MAIAPRIDAIPAIGTQPASSGLKVRRKECARDSPEKKEREAADKAAMAPRPSTNPRIPAMLLSTRSHRYLARSHRVATIAK